MKISNCFWCLMFIFSLSIFSCTKEKAPVKDRVNSSARNITINNQTGTEIRGYLVSTANGVEIIKGATNKNSFTVEIHKNFDNDPDIEVVLTDKYERVYAKTVKVPLKGNTDVSITSLDRKTEGLVKDKWKDFTAWINENK